MAIHLHRSNRTEVLVEMLCRVVGNNLPEHPFQEVPIVVGSRGMERWLRHEIATRLDIAAGLAFPFPRQAFTGATRWLLAGAADPEAAFWEVDPAAKEATQRWEQQAQAFRLVGLLRRHLGTPGFESVTRYLAPEGQTSVEGAVTARELLFAAEVGDVLDRLVRDRARTALAWADDPAAVEAPHGWVARLLADVGASTDPDSPAVLDRRLAAAPARETRRTLCVFGLSTMGPWDRRQLASIGRSMQVHLFVLVPTDHWFQHHRTRAEANAARRETDSAAERAQLEAELASDNPILTSLGAPSRDLQAWLEEVGYEGDRLEATDPAALPTPTVLQRLQSWILAAQGPEAVTTLWGQDRSLTAHSTYGALRQCEVLRDELLGMFAADETLEPRDVLVMTPDIETFAPLVAAVFSRRGPADDGAAGRLPAIPVAIADLGLSRTNPVAEVLLKTLEVAGDRLSAGWVLDFLALEPVRRRWQLGEDDLGDVRALVQDSGLRWGMDAADRERVGQPGLDQNTVRFALERLALGVLMPDDTELDVVPDLSGRLGPAVPLDVVGRERVARAGRLMGVLRTLSAHRSALSKPATLATWRERLVRALDELAETTDEAGWLRVQVDQALDDMTRQGALLGDLVVERAAVLRWLQGGFEILQRGDRAITGAVQVCALEPMRSVPFKVVALLGMDDGAFPRGRRGRTWDPMETRQVGERDRREVDRHLLLEAILSARERLLVLWSGHDVQQGSPQPAAVPVEELLETLALLTGRTREQLVGEHPLQPWSAGNFAAAPLSFDHGMAQAARLLHRIERGDQPATPLGLGSGGTLQLPPEIGLETTLELDVLLDALIVPQRTLLRDRLGLSVDREVSVIEDREPLELDTLDAWAVRHRILEHLMAGGVRATHDELTEALWERLRGEGILPLRAGGRAILSDEVIRARAVATHLEAVDGHTADPLDLSVPLGDGWRLVGRVDNVRTRGEEHLLQWYTASATANERLKLRAWLHLLAARAAGHEVVGARLVGYKSRETGEAAGGDFLTFSGDAAAARARLEELVALWRLARGRPLMLFRMTSSAIADVLVTYDDDLGARGAWVRLTGAVAAAWHGTREARGDVQNPWIATLFVDHDPLDHLEDDSDLGLIALARQVWLPVSRALQGGKAMAEAWRREDGT